MKSNKYFIIDFDSTFAQVETLNELARISLENSPDKKAVLDEITTITDKAMDGTITFRKSLEKRIDLLTANKTHIQKTIDRVKDKISKSFVRNKEFFRENADNIFIISNSFIEIIKPVATAYGIKAENIYANRFEFDSSGNITGFDKENILSSDNGKARQLERLNLKGDIHVIGDGYSDYEIKKSGVANKFYAFTENVERRSILEKADHVAPNLDEFLYQNKIKASVSYPKNRIKVLLLESVHQKAVDYFKEEGYNVEIHPAGMDEDELAEKIKDVSILGIRSKTHVTEKVLENANRLMAVGAFCIGTNQIDLDACLKKGVIVFNAPYSNTRSVVELVISEIVLLMRNLPDKISKMHEGKWQKTAVGSHEIRGKKLGIIGYGNIGSQLSVIAESLGMDVYYYDLVERLALGNATKCDTMEQLLALSDIVTLHVDGRSENADLIGKKEFEMMKEGAVFLNLSRGHVVDIDALKHAIRSGKISGAGIDVYPSEPKSNDEEFSSELRGLPNVILTPHIGGSTEEAQENIGLFVPGKIVEYINTGSTTNSVNFPEIQLPSFEHAHRLIHIHHNVPGVLANINKVIAKHDINIISQFLKTNESIGYMILSVDKKYDDDVIKELQNVEDTIRFRILY
ncbi:MAG TPA: phosphoglycerate dehydrogenase [Balneolaceae bacterium]|nr:phosphoglycerate dehydrogenase [Balneolaceae bacterium]